MTGVPQASPPLAPGDLLRPGTRDPLALLVAWSVRKATLPLLWLGFIIALLARRADGIHLGLDSADSVGDRLTSPLAAVVIAILLWFGTAIAALVLAYPMARDRARALPAIDGRGARFAALTDRIAVTRALRALRWTTHVRQEAARRLGDTGRRIVRIDRFLDIANWVLLVLVPVVAIVTAEELRVTA